MPKLKKKISPLLEFKNDPMMREIHENRIKLFEETKHMKKEDRIRFIKEKALRFETQKKFGRA